MRKAPIVVITGHSRSGKDTVADTMMEYLKDLADVRSVKRPFAEPLYKLTIHASLQPLINTLQVYPITPEQTNYIDSIIDGNTWNQWLLERKEHVLRPLLQGYGQMMRDLLGKDFWIKLNELAINAVSPHTAVFIPDCRYLNEAHWAIHNDSTYLIQVVRPDVQPEGDHSSVVEVDMIAKAYSNIPVIHNDGSLEELQYRADDMMNMILQQHVEKYRVANR